MYDSRRAASDRVTEAASLIKKKLNLVRAAAAEKASQATENAAWLVREVRPPPVRTWRPTQGSPVVPVWAVYAIFLSLILASAASLVVAFFATEGEGWLDAPNSFLDAAARACGADGKPKASGGLSWRTATWLGVALGLSSGLCAIHPLQSGLVLGF